MNLFDATIITVALSLSVFPTAMTSAIDDCLSVGKSIRMALFYGIIKGGLLALGYWICSTFKHLLADSAFYITFGIFLVLGIKMVFQSIKINPEERRFHVKNSLILIFSAIAINLDGLIAGLAFALQDIHLGQITLMIAFYTFLVSLGAAWYGKKVGRLVFASRIELIGGLILVGYSLFIFMDEMGFINLGSI